MLEKGSAAPQMRRHVISGRLEFHEDFMSTRKAELLWRQTPTHATWSSSAEFLTECWRHLTSGRTSQEKNI